MARLQRALRQLDHVSFERVLGQWFGAQELAPDELLAIDGKTMRGIYRGERDEDPRHPLGRSLYPPDARGAG